MLRPLLLILLSLHSVAASTATATATATLRPVHPTPSTIPAFPEQSAATSSSSSSCPLTLPLPRPPPSLRHLCSTSSRRLHCCPALATLLFSSYPRRHSHPSSFYSTRARGYDMPEVPEDTETCSEEVGKALRESGVAVSYRNASCDLVFCYCGIRLHRLNCDMDDGLFSTRVGSLARDCVSPGLTGCSKCLTSLNKLTITGNDTAASEDARTAKMHDHDCQLMALSWLLAKNHSAYSPTVTGVFRAMMSTPGGSISNLQSCTLGSDGLPLAADSFQVSGNSSPPRSSALLCVMSLTFLVLALGSFHFLFLVL